MRRALGMALVALLAGGWEGPREADPDVEQGNRAYREGHFAEALGRYRAAEDRGAEPALHFDVGAALYKLAEAAADPEQKGQLLKQAEEAFRRAADTDDAALKSSAYFNLGNTLYQREQWEDAIAAYKRALRTDPKNDAARNNLEMALRKRQKDDPPPQQGQKGQKGQKQGQQDKKDKKDKQPGQGDQDEKDKQGQDQQQGDQQQGDQDPQGDQQKDPQQGDQQQDQQDQKGQQQGQTQGGDKEQKRPDGKQGSGKDDPKRDRPPASPPSDPGGTQDESSPSDQDRKLDELERRSRDLRKRLLRQGNRTRDAGKLPSRRDW